MKGGRWLQLRARPLPPVGGKAGGSHFRGASTSSPGRCGLCAPSAQHHSITGPEEDGVRVQCAASGWFPKPQVQWPGRGERSSWRSQAVQRGGRAGERPLCRQRDLLLAQPHPGPGGGWAFSSRVRAAPAPRSWRAGGPVRSGGLSRGGGWGAVQGWALMGPSSPRPLSGSWLSG